MSERKRIILLICIMATACLTVGGIAILLLYRTAFEEQQVRLVETAQSQARLIEAVARFNAIYRKGFPEGPEKATLSQVVDAHKRYKGFGKTGEFTLARHEEDYIVFLLTHRHEDLDELKPVPFGSQLAEPMRRALSGLSGTMIGLDYRGEEVVAAYEPVAELGLGIVAKIDLTEVRMPFLKAGVIVGSLAVLVVLVGSGCFVHITNPIIRRLEKHSRELQDRVKERTAELQSLSSRLITAQEDERARISRELHDSIGQSLAAIKVVAESALSQINQGEEESGVRTVKALVPLVQDAREEVRRIYTDLRPSMLDDLGLVSTVSWFCREFEKVYSGIRIEKELQIQEKEIPESLKIVIFRLLQESLNNAAKYSKADLLRVSLKRSDGHIELVIEDNGGGFDVEKVQSIKTSTGGFGLTSMKERTELSGGSFSVDAKPGSGTTIRACW